MKLSKKWLAEFVDLEESDKDFSDSLTMSGSKVEEYIIEGAEITNVVVGQVKSINPHPDADKLVICQIDIGSSEMMQIVTGATNLYTDALVPVALNNSTLPNGIKIKKGKLRGIESQGMLCSLSELNLTVNDFPYAIEDGIFIIEEKCTVGEDIKSALSINDTIFEFEITPNRPDCLSIIGLSKEVAATYKVPFKQHTPKLKEESNINIKDIVNVDILNKDLCKRFTARAITDVKIQSSPRFIRERLRSSGIRPINNIVDITNYVMLEYGQPLHSYDADLIKGKKIIVKTSDNCETITTLDGVDRKLSDNMLVISDTAGNIGIAGVMGGISTSITNSTTTIVLEAANFVGSNIRATSKLLGLRTDASSKFEKGLDPQNTIDAINRACELIELINAGKVVKSIIDIDYSNKTVSKIKLDDEWINKFLGTNISINEMVDILSSLGFEVKDKTVIVPSYRADIAHKADIAEEIARIYGYDNIPTTSLRGVANGKLTDRQKFERIIHNTIKSTGCFEVCTYSFISPKYYDKINIPMDSKLRDYITIKNPLGEDTSIMRTTTIPSIMEVMAHNYNNRNDNFYCYEIGNEYIKTSTNELPDENPQITIGIYGNDTDFYTLKSIVQTLLQKINIGDIDVKPQDDNSIFHPGRCAELFFDNEYIGIIGEIHPLVLENYSITTKFYIAKLDLNTLFKISLVYNDYVPLPKYPSSTRDLSLICDINLPVIEIQNRIKEATQKYLEKIKLFDIYIGENIPPNHKSVAYNITLRSKDETLTDEKVDKIISNVLCSLEKIGVKLRS